MKKISITIGIPAYNEAANISKLLEEIAGQNNADYSITEVIVYSDGSTDDTVRIAGAFKALPVNVICHRTRQGKATAINAIFQKAKGDIVVLFDADISLIDTDTVSKLIHDIASGKADLSGAHVAELPAKNIFQRLLKSSMEYKKSVFASLHGGNNVHTCHGRGRAFSRKLFSTLRFTHSQNEDAYSYLYCIKNGYRYTYIPNAIVWYTLPECLRDHEYQSVRYFQSRHMSDLEFGKKFVDTAYAIPVIITVTTLLKHMMKDPIIIPYLALSAYLSVKSRLVGLEGNKWNVAISTKKILKEAKI